VTLHRLPFESVFADESGGNIKTPQGEYLSEGEFPIVDQGKALVGGYTDHRERLCGQGRPAIVFGDHTRCIKYIDFAFCMGADGVKVLRPRIEADLKYLYYFLKSLDIPSSGYDRHYKYLKRTEIVLSPIHEQRRIAAILDQADALRAKRREVLAQLDSLTQSIFIEMFGDFVVNPRGFSVSLLGKVCDVRDGTHDSPKYVTDGFPLVTSKNLSGGYVDLTDVNLISERDYDAINKRSKVDLGDLLMPMIGTIGNPVLIEDDPAYAVKNVAIVKFPKGSPSNIFIRAVLSGAYFDHVVSQKNRGGTQKFLSLGDLRTIPVPLPQPSLQQTFATRIQAVESLKATHRAALTELDALFASLQHRAFAGQL
jgi:restriction endonuclease S subunit